MAEHSKLLQKSERIEDEESVPVVHLKPRQQVTPDAIKEHLTSGLHGPSIVGAQ